MATSRYYEFVLIFTPIDDEGNEGKAKLISDGIQGCLASGEQEAQMVAARSIPDEYSDKLDQIQIGLRPF